MCVCKWCFPSMSVHLIWFFVSLPCRFFYMYFCIWVWSPLTYWPCWPFDHILHIICCVFYTFLTCLNTIIVFMWYGNKSMNEWKISRIFSHLCIFPYLSSLFHESIPILSWPFPHSSLRVSSFFAKSSLLSPHSLLSLLSGIFQIISCTFNIMRLNYYFLQLSWRLS